MKGYYIDIENNAHVEIKTIVPLIKTAIKEGTSTTKEPIKATGYSYTLQLQPTISIDKHGDITLTLEWEDDKEQLSQTISIKQEESHLIPGAQIYYFESDSHKCRKIYYIKKKFRSNKEFKHRYKIQGKNRELKKEIAISKNPHKRYGKKRYKNKLTPYGRKCVKYKQARIEYIIHCFEDVSEVEKSIATKIKGMLELINKNAKEAKATYSSLSKK